MKNNNYPSWNLDFAFAFDLIIANIYFKKREDHLILHIRVELIIAGYQFSYLENMDN